MNVLEDKEVKTMSYQISYVLCLHVSSRFKHHTLKLFKHTCQSHSFVCSFILQTEKLTFILRCCSSRVFLVFRVYRWLQRRYLIITFDCMIRSLKFIKYTMGRFVSNKPSGITSNTRA